MQFPVSFLRHYVFFIIILGSFSVLLLNGIRRLIVKIVVLATLFLDKKAFMVAVVGEELLRPISLFLRHQRNGTSTLSWQLSCII